MKIFALNLAVASLLMLAACSGGGEDTTSTGPADGGKDGPPASAAYLAPAPADGTVVILDVEGMT